MNKVIIAVLALFASTAYAQNYAGAVAGSSSNSNSASGAISAATQGNSQGITFNTTNPARIDTHTSGGYTLHTAPMIYAPPVGVTAPCHTALSGGVSVIGVGLTAGGSVEDVECTLRETARILHGIGQIDAAARIMCHNAKAAVALGTKVCPDAPAVTPLSASGATSGNICAQAKAQKDDILLKRNNCQ